MDFKRFLKNTSNLVFPFIFVFASTLSAQDITLMGHVYSGSTSSGELIPVAGAQVGIGMNSVPEGTITHSDENGYYKLHFEWNWDGPIPIICEAEGYEFFLATIFPGGNSIEIEFDIVLTPASGGGDMTHLEGSVWQNNGCLGGPVGCPIEGAIISAVPLNSPNDVVFTAVSDHWGHYILELPIGDYMVTCSAEGWQSETIDLAIDAEGANHDFHLFEEGNNTEVYFSGYVSGEVAPELPAYAPIEGAVVFLFGGFTGGILAETHTDENGYFEFGDVVMSATSVSVEANGYLGQDYSIFDLCELDSPNTVECFPLEHDFYLNLESQSIAEPYDLTVEFEPLPLGGIAHLNWQYDGDISTQVTNFNIYVHYGLDDMDWTFVSTSAETTFDYMIGDFWWPEELCFKVTAATADGMETEPSNTACVDFNPDPSCEDLSDYHFGDCEMVIGIGWNGEHCTWFSGCGTVDQYGVDHADSFFNSMEECNAACTDVAENGALAGEVFYQWGDAIELVAGALIQVHSSAGFIFESETNENGFYLIEEIPAGNYVITCTVYTEESMTQEVEIIAGTSAILDFWFGEPWYETSLMGMVYDANHENQIVNEAHIMAHSADGVIIETYSYEGFYWLSLPGAGTYYLTVSAEGYLDLNATFDVQWIMEHDFYLTPAEDIPGDINFDGEVNVLDVVALVNFVIFIEEPTDTEFAAGDLNNDGTLNILDVVLMVNMILSGDTLPEGCFIEPEVGPCDGICPTYYYNQDTGTCEEFITGCCGVEAFDTLEECEEACE